MLDLDQRMQKKENDDNPGFGRIYRAFSGLSEYAGTE